MQQGRSPGQRAINSGHVVDVRTCAVNAQPPIRRICYRNRAAVAIEAVDVFPLPEDAAVFQNTAPPSLVNDGIGGKDSSHSVQPVLLPTAIIRLLEYAFLEFQDAWRSPQCEVLLKIKCAMRANVGWQEIQRDNRR